MLKILKMCILIELFLNLFPHNVSNFMSSFSNERSSILMCDISQCKITKGEVELRKVV